MEINKSYQVETADRTGVRRGDMYIDESLPDFGPVKVRRVTDAGFEYRKRKGKSIVFGDAKFNLMRGIVVQKRRECLTVLVRDASEVDFARIHNLLNIRDAYSK